MSLDLGKYVDEMHAIRSEKRHHESEIKRLDASLKLMESTIMQEMINQGLTEVKGVHGKVVYNKDVLYPHVESWEEFHKYIQETGFFDLLHKRISLTKYRELAEAELDPPGVLRNYTSEISLGSL